MPMFNKWFVGGSGNASVPDADAVGRELLVDDMRVTIDRQLAQGGFAVVFLAHDSRGTEYALKKMSVHDEDSVLRCRQEISFMRLFSNNKNIVKLFAADEKSNGRFTEFMMVMEYCPGGHVVDIMNRRLKRPFSEAEVLKIFGDACMALHALHHSQPPVIHRDIKPENILLSRTKGQFKLCDFGSATTVPIIPGTDCPVPIVEEEIERFTTIQYRAPEMVDLYLGNRIDERSDMWAMGCLLYKLCFFQDAFEGTKLSVLSGKYRIPAKHNFSPDMLQLIKALLEPEPKKRVNIDTATKMVFALRNLPCPVEENRPSSLAFNRRDSFADLRRAAPHTPGSTRVVSMEMANPFETTAASTTPSSIGQDDWANFGEQPTFAAFDNSFNPTFPDPSVSSSLAPPSTTSHSATLSLSQPFLTVEPQQQRRSTSAPLSVVSSSSTTPDPTAAAPRRSRPHALNVIPEGGSVAIPLLPWPHQSSGTPQEQETIAASHTHNPTTRLSSVNPFDEDAFSRPSDEFGDNVFAESFHAQSEPSQQPAAPLGASPFDPFSASETWSTEPVRESALKLDVAHLEPVSPNEGLSSSNMKVYQRPHSGVSLPQSEVDEFMSELGFSLDDDGSILVPGESKPTPSSAATSTLPTSDTPVATFTTPFGPIPITNVTPASPQKSVTSSSASMPASTTAWDPFNTGVNEEIVKVSVSLPKSTTSSAMSPAAAAASILQSPRSTANNPLGVSSPDRVRRTQSHHVPSRQLPVPPMQAARTTALPESPKERPPITPRKRVDSFNTSPAQATVSPAQSSSGQHRAAATSGSDTSESTMRHRSATVGAASRLSRPEQTDLAAKLAAAESFLSQLEAVPATSPSPRPSDKKKAAVSVSDVMVV